VNQKKRRLRLGAFNDVNKMCDDCPKSKIAVLKRSYRKNPQYGYCPSPESSWARMKLENLNNLEHVLHYFHVELQNALTVLFDGDRKLSFLANVDVAAADAIIASDEAKQRESVLSSTYKYFSELSAVAAEKKFPLPASSREWINFTAIGQKTQKKDARIAMIAPKILSFDESSGTLLERQDKQVEASDSKGAHTLPWKTWWSSESAAKLGTEVAAANAVVSVLFSLYKQGAFKTAQVEVLYQEGKGHKRVVASKDLAPGELVLAPCVPKGNKVLATSEHPFRVQVVATEGKTAEATGQVLYINPEWIQPKEQETEHGPARPSSKAKQWEWNGAESMNPFWAVRRLTEAQLAQEPAAPDITGFNVELSSQEFTQVTVGCVKKESTSSTWTISLPLMSNSAEIKQGVELVLRHVPTSKSKPEKTRTWKSDQRQSDAERKRRRVGTTDADADRI
jgi:hypothetical protein